MLIHFISFTYSVCPCSHVHLKVLPQITPFATNAEPTHLGQYITYQCTLTEGDLPLTIRWTFNKQPLFNDQDQDILIAKMGRRSSVLTIESVAARHAGNYSCHGENAAGKATYSTQLRVIGAPSLSLALLLNLHHFVVRFCLKFFSHGSLFSRYRTHLQHFSFAAHHTICLRGGPCPGGAILNAALFCACRGSSHENRLDTEWPID